MTRGQLPALVCALGLMPQWLGSVPSSVVRPATPVQAAVERQGADDFDFEIGTWTTRLSRRLRPFSGSTDWVEYKGTSVVRKIWNGGANLVELNVEGQAGRIEGLSLRLYHPQARQWSVHYANRNDGLLSPAVTGGFSNGRGEFYGEDTLNGRAILVRFVISEITADRCRFEQAFSDDGGKTWEVNWIAVDTRVAGPVQQPHP